MTEEAQTETSNARPASAASERADSISAGPALGKPPGSGISALLSCFRQASEGPAPPTFRKRLVSARG